MPTKGSPTLQEALKDGFGEAVVACKFPSLYNCKKRFLRTHQEVDLAPHPVVGLMLQVGDTKKSPHALGVEESASSVHVLQL